MTSKRKQMDVFIKGPVSAFGDLVAHELQPHIQVDAHSGLRTNTDMEVFTNAGGTACVTDTGNGRVFKAETAGTVGSFGVVRTIRPIRYRPGIGNSFMFTAAFTDCTTGAVLRAGAMNIGNELAFGYEGPDFGILHKRGGRVEIRKLVLQDLTSAAGGETATLLLDGATFTASLTSGGFTHTAFELAAGSYTTWENSQNNGNVTFTYKRVGALTGEFSYTTTGNTAGDFTTVAVGQDNTETFIAQSSWNGHRLLGGDSSHNDPFVLDPLKGNVYKIQLQYLGFGAIDFLVEDPASGEFLPVHKIKYANANSVPSLDVPVLKVGLIASNSTNNSTVACYSACMAAFDEGRWSSFRNPESKTASRTGIGTDFTNLLSIRVRTEFKGVLNLSEVFPVLADVAVDGTKPAEVQLFLNPSIGGETNWQYVNENNSTVEFSTAGDTVSSNGVNTLEIVGFALSKTGDKAVDLQKLNIHLQRLDVLTLAVKASSGTTDATGSFTWQED